MRIGELAEITGLSRQTLRYYERLGLLVPARSANGYRSYGEAHVETLAFIKRLKRLGIRLEEIKEILRVREAGKCPCGQMRERLTSRLVAIEMQLQELEDLRGELAQLLDEGSPLCTAGTTRS